MNKPEVGGLRPEARGPQSTARNPWRLLGGTLRPRQWVKSSFILAPALFTLKLLDPSTWPVLLAGLFGFSLVSSAVYAFNDICNRGEDRLHPDKRYRPVASGELAVWKAALLSIVSLVIGVGLLLWTDIAAVLIAAVYVVLMVAYTLYLRQLLVLDVIIVAIGFVLRVLAGALIIHEPVSHWLLLCTFTIALFLGMIKRRQEIVVLGAEGSGAGRAVLAHYPDRSILDGWINVLTGMTVICYALYTVDPHTTQKHHTGALIYTLPFVLYGIFRYQQLALVGRAGEDPTKLLLSDPVIKVVVLLWAVCVGVILYLAR